METIKNIIISTLSQFCWLVGIMAIGGIILYLLARTARRLYASASKSAIDIYITGWIGTPVHEFGHWIFCIIFLHKVKEVRFFKPDSKAGVLGYVSHTYDKKSIYQKIGNYFIGIGPILVGSILLAVLAYFTLPNKSILIKQFSDFVGSWAIEVSYGPKTALTAIADSVLLMLKSIVVPRNITSLYFWAFIYVATCVSSHMKLSTSDIKLAAFGALTILATLLIANSLSVFVALFYKNALTLTISDYLMLWSLKFGAATIFLLSFSIILSSLNLLIALLVKGVASALKK